jgi:GT2 family glycosyltransferase
MRLSIIIPVYNNYNFTKACLEDLSTLPNDHEIILVDNGSDDKTKDIPCSIRNKTNLGFARACNQGFSKASGEYVLFLNNDIRVESNHTTWTEDLIQAAEDGSLVGPTGGLLDDSFSFVKETTEVLPGNFYMSGWCLCGKKETFQKLDINNNEIFSEEFVSYYEDTDLSFRAQKLGIKFKIVPVPVYHFGRMTGRKLGLGALYLNGKSIFVKKWEK